MLLLFSEMSVVHDNLKGCVFSKLLNLVYQINFVEVSNVCARQLFTLFFKSIYYGRKLLLYSYEFVNYLRVSNYLGIIYPFENYYYSLIWTSSMIIDYWLIISIYWILQAINQDAVFIVVIDLLFIALNKWEVFCRTFIHLVLI